MVMVPRLSRCPRSPCSGLRDSPRWRSKDQASDAVLQQRDVEIDEQTDAMTRQLQVREELGLEQRAQPVDGRHFNDDQPPDDQVQAKPRVKADPVIDDRKWYLAGK